MAGRGVRGLRGHEPPLAPYPMVHFSLDKATVISYNEGEVNGLPGAGAGIQGGAREDL